ncbi:hypothetical protein [Cytobacillus solani]|uniref:Uncharacterized protein n=1 Tax=Cytobacillus solani TaxID=1637975 RepID=A0A0Q3VIF2_9BACI|nr:hypothetical protein [Cytobacillus solani]KOP81976.1 hypothetical protein AMS60_05440 [Bacillus sp. FJAT-21945]KQL20498.1 hypothetical protein AN957_19185 [Cytobacillus solani]
MQEQTYNHSPSTYTLEVLSSEYRSSDLARTEKKQIDVTDEEVCLFLDHAHKCWPIVFWVFSSVIAVLFMFGVIQN